MRLKVEIEKAIFELSLQPVINIMIDKALNSSSLDQCYEQFLSLKKDNRVSFGKGGNHIWVSEKSKRILLIKTY